MTDIFMSYIDKILEDQRDFLITGNIVFSQISCANIGS